MKKALTFKQQQELIEKLKVRFEQNSHRHKEIHWVKVQKKLEANPDKLWSLNEMERTEGEPDVIAIDSKTGEIIFYDCSIESPKGRRSLCYDQKALDARKENKPVGSAMGMALAMGIDILNEEEYRKLQMLGQFDAKTSSWIKTPEKIRKLDGALFADYRFEHVFVYHNGASSYYAARGFRGLLRI